jgi:hypothetical protein
MKILSPNAADSDVDVTAYLFELTHSLPDAVAGAANGLFIAGTNAATVITTSLTTTFTGNLTGTVAKSPATIAAGDIANNAITAAAIADGAIDNATFAVDTVCRSMNSGAVATKLAATLIEFNHAVSSGVDNYYDGCVIQITSGTAVGQARVVKSYVGSTHTATVTEAWATIPEVADTYVIHPLGDVEVGLVNTGAITAASFAAGAINAAAIADGAIDAATFAANAITNAAVADDVDVNCKTMSNIDFTATQKTLLTTTGIKTATTAAPTDMALNSTVAKETTLATVDTVVDLIEDIMRNKMTIKDVADGDAAGTVTLYADNNSTELFKVSACVTDDSTTTTRLRLA